MHRETPEDAKQFSTAQSREAPSFTSPLVLLVCNLPAFISEHTVFSKICRLETQGIALMLCLKSECPKLAEFLLDQGMSVGLVYACLQLIG